MFETQKQYKDEISSLFVGSFNMNGNNISKIDAEKWLNKSASSKNKIDGDRKTSTLKNHTNAIDSDLVILSLQECPTAPCQDYYSSTDRYQPIVQIMTSSISSTKQTKDQISSVIQSVLSKNHTLVADLAMGETPCQTSKWYGYIRLLVFAKRNVLHHIHPSPSSPKRCSTTSLEGNEMHHSNKRHCGTYHNASRNIIPILVPVGRKANDKPEHHPFYKQNQSPDKGAVCLYIPKLEWLICSMHLCGTNQYNVPEDHFDAIRVKEINTIAETCVTTLRNAEVVDENTNYSTILCGDLNFRVEVYSEPKEKKRGGRDFQAVSNVLNLCQMSNDKSDAIKLNSLFHDHDRLLKLLRFVRDNQDKKDDSLEVSPFSSLSSFGKNLMNANDTIQLFAKSSDTSSILQYKVFFPSFTFPKVPEDKQASNISSSMPHRKYADKRTPSWTDRILVNDLFLQLGWKIDSSYSNHDILSSDHVPVSASFHFSHEIV